MPPDLAARQSQRLFWGVCGGSLLVVCGFTLAWVLGSRNVLLLTFLQQCCVLVWQVSHHFFQWMMAGPLRSGPMALLLGSGLWATGRLLTAWWRTQSLLRYSVVYSPGSWGGLDRALASLPQVAAPLRLLPISQPIACTVGLWRPRIIFSTGLLTMLSPVELAAVLGHEWGHVQHRDPLRLALLRFWRELLWFLPILRTLTQRGAWLVEAAADDVAVTLTRQPLDLAAALVKTAQAQVSLPVSALSALHGNAAITERVERLLELASSQPRQRHGGAWVSSFGVTLGLLGFLLLPTLMAIGAPRFSFVSSPVITCVAVLR